MCSPARAAFNDFSSRNQGVDLVSTYAAPPALGGDTVLSVTMNHTHTALTEESQLLTPGDVLGLERGVPRIRWNAAINQQVARVGVLARLNYYGAWVDHFAARFVRGTDAPLLDGRYIVDLEASIGFPNGTSDYWSGAKANRFIDPMNPGDVEVSQGTADIASRSVEALGGTFNYLTDDPAAERTYSASTTIGENDGQRSAMRVDTEPLFGRETRAWVAAVRQEATDWVQRSARNEREHVAARLVSSHGQLRGDGGRVSGVRIGDGRWWGQLPTGPFVAGPWVFGFFADRSASGGVRELGRRAGVCDVAEPDDGGGVSPAHGGGMGTRGCGVSAGMRFPAAGDRGHVPGRFSRFQRGRLVGHGGQRVGVHGGLLGG